MINWVETSGYSHGITWRIYENGEVINEQLFEQINRYGLSGDFIEATATLKMYSDLYYGVVILNFENVTYHAFIPQLVQLNSYSEDTLNNWLTNGGYETLESAFARVDFMTVDENGQSFDEDPRFGKEFISWSFEHSDLVSFENSFIEITRHYRILEPTREQAQQFVLERLAEIPSDQYLAHRTQTVGGYALNAMSEWLGIERELFEEIIFFQVRNLDINGNSISHASHERDRIGANADTFIGWRFSYNVSSRDESIINVFINKTYDVVVD